MAAEGPGDLPVPDLQTMEELCQPSLNGRGGPIAPIAIQATNFGLKNDMIQQVQNSCQFHGLPGDDANKYLDKFLHVTQSIKVNGVTDDALRLYLFPHSLTHDATAWFDRLPRNSINTFEQMAKMFLGKYFPPSMVTKLRNKITNFRQHPDESLFEAWERYKLSIDRCPNHNMLPITQIDTFYNGLTLRHRDTINAAGGTFMKRPIVGNTQNFYVAGAYQGNSYQPQGNRNLLSYRSDNYLGPPGNIITNPKEDLKGITTRSGTAYQEPTIPTTSSLPSVVERETEATKDTVHLTKNRSTKDVQPLVVQTESPILTSEPVVAPIIEPVAYPVSAPKPNQRPSIPYPSRLQDQKLRHKANDKREKNFQIFKDLNFNISFADALILMPKFGPAIKTFLTNKDKLFELARTLLNEHCSMVDCLALADLGASINLMPLSVWNKLSLPDLSPTCMTLELTDSLISCLVGVSEDVFFKVGTFHFSTDFVVIDFDVDPRVPLIIERSFLKAERALIDVFEGKLTLRVSKEAIIFNLDQTSRYSGNYNNMTANRIDIIDMACEEYSQEVFDFSDINASGNPTPYYDSIVSNTSSTLTPFRNSDFLLEEVDAFLSLDDDPTSPKVDQSYFDFEGDILLLEAFLNDDPSPPPPNQEKTTLTCPYGTFAYRRMPFGLCNAPGMFQRCMMAIFHDMIKKTMEVFMDDFSEKSHFMVKEGIILGHKISKEGIEVDKAKVDVIAKLPHPTTFKGICSFLGHVGFYRRFIQDFLNIARPMTHLLEKDTLVLFSKECVKAFQTLKRKLTEAPILIAPDWDMPFELMCYASDFAIDAILGQRQHKHFRPIHYASKTMIEVESNYTTTEKEMLVVVYAFEKFRSYLIMNKIIMYTDHSALKYLFAKKYSKAILLCWVLLLQEFTFKVIDKKRAENLVADHLSRLENPHQNVLDPKEINESFSLETLNLVSTHGNSSTLLFADFANYHARNFVVNGMSSQQKSKFFKDVKHYFWDDPFLFKSVLIKSSEDMYTARKPLTFSRLATMDPPGDTMAQITQLRSDRGTHFCNDQFAKVMLKFDVTHHLATPYHPQTSGLVEVSNRVLKCILERTVGENRASWSKKLDDALWAF
uniref:RNA-directed DNA polymerase n=1 Tax=Tanacetum cinerariifolium TaxID=118510 RepID=A0A6L2MBC2_TANCI|nr:reverse transcriptase domain-containing protein [Tanacetum cinerariifolium]